MAFRATHFACNAIIDARNGDVKKNFALIVMENNVIGQYSLEGDLFV